jgi:hypothetical protein
MPGEEIEVGEETESEKPKIILSTNASVSLEMSAPFRSDV